MYRPLPLCMIDIYAIEQAFISLPSFAVSTWQGIYHKTLQGMVLLLRWLSEHQLLSTGYNKPLKRLLSIEAFSHHIDSSDLFSHPKLPFHRGFCPYMH